MATNSRPRGSAIVLVLIALCVIFIGAMYLTTSTIERGRQTTRAVAGDKAGCLAEAALPRALHLLMKGANNPAEFKPSAAFGSFATLVRVPLAPAERTPYSFREELGKDQILSFKALENAKVPLKLTFTEKDLRLLPEGQDSLDRMVAFMGDGRAKDYEIEVSVELDKAFRICPKHPKDEEYKVAGVDVPANMRKDVQDFLENKTSMGLIISFPSSMCLLSFSIPVKLEIPLVGSITLAKIDPVAILDQVVIIPLSRKLGFARLLGKSEGIGLATMFSLDFIAKKISYLAEKAGLGKIYPIELLGYEKDLFPKAAALWPKNSPKLPDDMRHQVEKYGTLAFRSRARIRFKDGTFTERRVEAKKEFKVADLQPMAPLYSLFCANASNDIIQLNDVGGSLYVNNSSRRVLPETARTKNKEITGQIRFNYRPADADGDFPGTPLLVNCGFLGHYQGPRFSTNDVENGLMNLVAGIDALLMLKPKKEMITTTATKVWNLAVGEPKPPAEDKVPKKMPGFTFKLTGKKWDYGALARRNMRLLHTDSAYKKYIQGKLQEQKAHKQYGKGNEKPAGWSADTSDQPPGAPEKDEKKSLLNFIPDVSDLSCNFIHFTVSVAMRALGGSAPNVSGITFGLDDGESCFESFELPWMGTSNGLFCLPTLGWDQNKTHLFGLNALFPTLSRDIEGMVAKRYRQWHICIVGFDFLDRLPLIPAPPPWCFVPPIPVPIWFADEVVSKYDYDFFFMKAWDGTQEAPDTVMSVYDPGLAANLPANFYTVEQFAKKATYFYPTQEEFLKDLPNRILKTADGKEALNLNGITFIGGSLGSNKKPFKPASGDTFYVTGRGMIVTSGHVFLGCNIQCVDQVGLEADPKRPPTVFSLIVRTGGLIVEGKKDYIFEGSLFTNAGMYLAPNTSLNVRGNWVTNRLVKNRMRGNLLIDFISSRVRMSLGSLRPVTGKYDQRRHFVTLAPTWSSWNLQ